MRARPLRPRPPRAPARRRSPRRSPATPPTTRRAAATAAYFFLNFSAYNLASLALYAASAAVFAMLLWSVLGGVVKRPPPRLPRLVTEGVAEADLRAAAERLAPALNRGLALTHRALGGREPLLSAGVAGALYVAGKAAARVSLATAAFLPVLAAFTLPKVYELRKEEVDAGIDTARARLTAVYDAHLAGIVRRIPRAGPASPAESSSVRKQQ